MKNSVSDHAFYIIESEDEKEDEVDVENEGEKASAGEESSEFNSDDGSPRPSRLPSSVNTPWPQSYRQSIDLYSSVTSPNIGFLGIPSSLSRLGSSFLSSTLTRRHTPEILSNLIRPLIPSESQRQPSADYLPPPPPSRRSSSLRPSFYDPKTGKAGHEISPAYRQCSYSQSVLNGVNVLCGVGILTTPYAIKEGGWIGLSILFIFGILSWYTGILLGNCLDSAPGLETYPDIGQAAFGTIGRVAISIVLYVELYACCVNYIILESDNLSYLFPNAHLTLGGIHFDSHHLFASITTLAVLPTVLLRDMSILSYISAGGVLASFLVVISLFWLGLVDKVGFASHGSMLNLPNLPVAVGLYGYCYSGHSVFPNIYSSMKKPSEYPSVLFTSFIICAVLSAGAAVMGYCMFGESTMSQFTLNMPQNFVASKIAVWTTVVNPFTKYALTMSPVAMSLEELIPSHHMKSHWYAILIRTFLVISTLIVGLKIPFFGLVISLIGSLLTMLVSFILPCVCFMSIRKGKLTRFQILACVIILLVGVVSCAIGTVSALSKIVENLS